MENSIWLSNSLFCNNSHRDHLLRDGIRPFLDQLYREEKIYSYSVAFNNSGGPNIRVAMMSEYRDAESVAKATDVYFKEFFRSAAYPEQQPEIPPNSIFMPFPANTIQYGLYSLYEDIMPNSPGEIFKKALSDLIMAALSEESFEEIILPFSFYLHLSWSRVLLMYNPGLEGEIGAVYSQSYDKKEISIDSDSIGAYLKENKEMTLEIVEDIRRWQQGGDPAVPSWFEPWMKLCGQTLKEAALSGQDTIPELKKVHARMIYRINEQLDLSDNMKLLLSYLISHSISQHSLQIS